MQHIYATYIQTLHIHAAYTHSTHICSIYTHYTVYTHATQHTCRHYTHTQHTHMRSIHTCAAYTHAQHTHMLHTYTACMHTLHIFSIHTRHTYMQHTCTHTTHICSIHMLHICSINANNTHMQHTYTLHYTAYIHTTQIEHNIIVFLNQSIHNGYFLNININLLSSKFTSNLYSENDWRFNSFGIKELLMRLQEVVFQPFRVSFSTTFLKQCGRGESLGTTTCLRYVVGGKQGYAACQILTQT